MKNLFRTMEMKMIALYVLTTVIMYCAFWFGWYLLSAGTAIGIALAVVTASGLIFAGLRKTAWAAMSFVFVTATAIGLSISAFFLALEITPSRFWGLCLIIMLAYKTGQAVLGGAAKNKKAFYSFFIFCIVVEIIAALIFAFSAYQNPPLRWQIFFALVVCFFYSCGQLRLRKAEEQNFWSETARIYLFGFILIFALIVVIIISIVTEDGSAFEGLFEGLGSGIGGDKKNKKKKP